MNSFLKDIDNYYTKKIKTHGATPLGVDWNSKESQLTRFFQLSKIIKSDNSTVNDIGCGYGDYINFLDKYFKDIDYTGYDLSREMIMSANNLYPKNKFIHISNLNQISNADFSIASGIFNVKLNNSNSTWLTYILNSLNKINRKSEKGFSFNLLTKYSEKKYMKKYLYYADPLILFDYCKKKFSKNVCLNHDYDLYEFTILVKKK